MAAVRPKPTLVTLLHGRRLAAELKREIRRLDETAADEGGILGPDLTVLDMYVAMLFIWFRGDLALPRLIRVAAKVRSLPVIAPIWRRHFGDR